MSKPEYFPFNEDESIDEEAPSAEDFIPQEEMSALLKEDEERLNVTIPQEAYAEISEFLTKFEVTGADMASVPEIELLWKRLLKSPSLVKDFTYSIMDHKRVLSHSEYPLTLKMDELIEYAEGFDRPLDVRTDLLMRTGKKIQQIGFDRQQYIEQAWDGPRAEQIRFFGWIVTQPFIGDLRAASKEFQRKYDVEEIQIGHLRTIVMNEVWSSLSKLKEYSKHYDENRSLDQSARQSHVQVVKAMEGIYRMCGVFLTNPDQKN